MTATPQMAEIAALIGDPGRANILDALADGRALTATELSFVARVSPQTTSGHLAKLTEGRLLQVERQGRHRYYRLASPLVGHMLEAIMALAAVGPPRHRPPSRIDAALRMARTCYDHLAGRLGVALADALVARGHVVLDLDGGEVMVLRRQRRAFCRPCLDWSERRPHLAGSIGAGLAERCFGLGWLKQMRDSRAVTVTAAGRAGLAETFGISIDEGARPMR
jgi:DNA-binding transcriptional ArsR family regulator